MGQRETGFSRRDLLAIAAGVTGLTFSNNRASALPATPSGPVFTPSIILGPFYPQMKPPEEDADLTRLAGRQKRADGNVVHLSGRITNLKGEPVSGARVSIWQANTYGRYWHKSDTNPAPLDPNFQGFGVQTTDADGRYHFKTIKPGAYPAPVVGMRAPHVHFEIEAKYDRLITQMFFPNEELNAQDHFLQFVKGPQREAVMAKPTTASESGSLSYVWDIVLLSG
ncbi:MAG TPA: protocatechuate 3,4-dioxygenase [Thermoanaerobaculia bacterium]|nr:protocatechuate 3,4-dioxygenase [Thermoanaerobaculia bacterium]